VVKRPTLKSSSLNFPLKDSIYPFSNGLRGEPKNSDVNELEHLDLPNVSENGETWDAFFHPAAAELRKLGSDTGGKEFQPKGQNHGFPS